MQSGLGATSIDWPKNIQALHLPTRIFLLRKTQHKKEERIHYKKNSHVWFNVNKVEELSVNTIFENLRDKLLYDIDPAGENF